jgi:hypothetical protein
MLNDFTEKILCLIASIPVIVFDGWVLSVVWGWFITPVFNVNLTIVQAIGFNLVVSLLIPHPLESKETIYDAIINDIEHGLLVLFIGWILHFF